MLEQYPDFFARILLRFIFITWSVVMDQVSNVSFIIQSNYFLTLIHKSSKLHICLFILPAYLSILFIFIYFFHMDHSLVSKGQAIEYLSFFILKAVKYLGIWFYLLLCLPTVHDYTNSILSIYVP